MSTDSCYSVIDDGHKPAKTNVPTQLLFQTKSPSHFLIINDNLLSDVWLTRSYVYAKELNKPWGAFVSTSDVLDETIDTEFIWKTNPQKAIALIATKALLFDKTKKLLPFDDMVSQVDVTAVWCLSSGLTNEVEYHIDYAELYRYETNIIEPPIFAGTCHLSPFTCREDMIGGDFRANIKGLEHYQQFGYKGKLVSRERLQHDLDSSNDWITVPYKCNRGIVHDGDYPHLSTQITYLRTCSSGGGQQEKRIILGFNCFPKGAAADCTRRTPEHSDAFNRTVKLYQTMSSAYTNNNQKYSNITENSDDNVNVIGKESNNRNNHETNLEASIISSANTTILPTATKISLSDKQKLNNRVSLDDIKKNPFLTKLIIKAAKSYKLKDANTQQQNSV